MNIKQERFTWPLFLLMASVTFMAILSEMAPVGIMPQLRKAFGVGETQGGNFVGYYALASAICAIPLIALTTNYDRKRLLMVLLLGFALSNAVVAVAPSYAVAMGGRILGGICAGVLWPMISAYGIDIAPRGQSAKAIAVIMGGVTVGMSLGLPLFTWIGETFGWQADFLVMTMLLLLITVGCFFALPAVPGRPLSKENSPLTIIKNPTVIVALLLTVTAIVAHYTSYIYIADIVEEQGFGNVVLAQALFGVGSIVSVVLATMYADKHLYALTAGMLAIGAVTMLLFWLAGTNIYISYLSYILWGLAFGALVAIFQAATTKDVPVGKDVATSLQSATFNFSIMIATALGGMLLGSSVNVNAILIASLSLLVVSTLIAVFSKRRLAD